MHHPRPLLAVALAAGALALAAAPSARADGDPAGDVLATQSVFYGSALDLRSKPAAQLPALLAAAKERGYEIKVAALSVPADLGAITYLWDDPQNYAEFLAQELVYIYVQRTLVVMPGGYAIVYPGHSSAREQRILDRLAAPGKDPTAVIPGAMDAVVALAAARGVELTIPDVEPPPGGVKQPRSHFQQTAAEQRRPPPVASSGGSSGWLFALPMLAVAVAASALIGRRRLQARRARRA